MKRHIRECRREDVKLKRSPTGAWKETWKINIRIDEAIPSFKININRRRAPKTFRDT